MVAPVAAAAVAEGVGKALGGLFARLTARDIEEIPREVIALWENIMNNPAKYDTGEFTPQERRVLGDMGLDLGPSAAAGLRATDFQINPAYDRGIQQGLEGVRALASQGMTPQEMNVAQQGMNMMQQQESANLAGTQRNLQARGLRSSAAGVAAGAVGAQNAANAGAGFGQALGGIAAGSRQRATLGLPGMYEQAAMGQSQRGELAARRLDAFKMWAAGLEQNQQQVAAQMGQKRDAFNVNLRMQNQEGNLARARGEKIRGQTIGNRARESNWNQEFAAARQWTNAQNELNRILQAQNAADAELFTEVGGAGGAFAGSRA